MQGLVLRQQPRHHLTELGGKAESQAPSQTLGIKICILALQVIRMRVCETLL